MITLDIIFYGIYGGVVLAYISVRATSHASQKRREGMTKEEFNNLKSGDIVFIDHVYKVKFEGYTQVGGQKIVRTDKGDFDEIVFLSPLTRKETLDE